MAESWTRFIHSVWRCLDWANRDGFIMNTLPPERQEARWQQSAQTAQITRIVRLYAERQRQLRAQVQKKLRKSKAQQKGHDTVRFPQAEIVVWNIPFKEFRESDIVLGQFEKDVAAAGCRSYRHKPGGG